MSERASAHDREARDSAGTARERGGLDPPRSDDHEAPSGHGGHGHGGHGHGGHGHGLGTAPRALGLAFVLTASFMVVEAVVGLWAGSLALLADAGHMLADAGALALALLAQLFAARPRTPRSTYGFRRAEVLAAFVNGIALAATALVILYEGITRLLHPEPISARAMLVVAALGLAVNLVSAAILSRSRGESVNVRAALAHVLLDALGSVAALVAGAFAIAGEPLADPLLAMLIAVLVAYSGWRVLKETTTILLEGVPAHLDVHQLERAILEVEGVAGVHDLHVWRIADRFDVATVHVTLGAEAHGVAVAAAVGERLRRDFGLNHVTVQPELRAEDRLLTLAARR